jgi:hypothetical protein
MRKLRAIPSLLFSFSMPWLRKALSWYTPEIAAWSWDLERIRAKNHTDNVVELMIAKLNRLSVTTREVLKQLACLGRQHDAVVHETAPTREYIEGHKS